MTVDAVISSFGESTSITNVAFDGAGANVLFATSDGALVSLSVAGATQSQVGAVGAGAWSLALHADSGRLAVVNAMVTDEAGTVIDAGGVTLTTVGGTAAAKTPLPGVESPSESIHRHDSISRPGGRSDGH